MTSKLAKLNDAVLFSETDQVRSLLRSDIDVNEVDEEGCCPIHYAVGIENFEIVRLLLEAGADPNAVKTEIYDDDEMGSDHLATPAMLACVASDSMGSPTRVETLRLLAEAGANLNAQDAEGKTAMMYAVIRGASAPDAVGTLLELGANPDIADRGGMTPIMAAYASLEDPYMGDACREILDILREAGASGAGLVNVDLLAAVEQDDIDAMRRLIGEGADVNFVGEASPLIAAAAKGNAEAVRLLLDAGADPNLAEGHAGFTPIIAAASHGRLEIVKMLVEAGGNPTARSKYDGSALDQARIEGSSELAAYLESLGVPEEDLSELRGVASFDVNESAVLVRASIDEVTEAFRQVRKASKVDKDVYDRTVISTDRCFIVYQFRGHPWTTIQTVHADSLDDEVQAEDALNLSQQLKTQTIFYLNSDTAMSVFYALFDKGRQIELLDYGDDEEQEYADWREDVEGDVEIEDHGMDVPRFVSAIRDVKPAEITDVYEFVNTFFVERDAYVAGWSDGARETREPGREFAMRGWPKDCFERVDFVVG